MSTSQPKASCLNCGKPATTTKNGTTVPLCSGCARLTGDPRGVEMTGTPKKKRGLKMV